MRILSVEDRPFHVLEFENAGRNGRAVPDSLPLLRAEVDSLPFPLEAILATSDLQGREPRRLAHGTPRLLGEALAEELVLLSGLGEVPPLDRVGIALAGDLFTVPELDRRGGTGDVQTVWRAFARCCRWVMGVAGNHDLFGEGASIAAARLTLNEPNVHVLDGDTVSVDGLRIGGVSGIVGDPRRSFRHDEHTYIDLLLQVLSERPDVLVLHDGPDVPGGGFKGSSPIREALELYPQTLVVRGHAHWKTPLVSLPSGMQFLNVDSIAVLLTPTTRKADAV